MISMKLKISETEKEREKELEMWELFEKSVVSGFRACFISFYVGELL